MSARKAKSFRAPLGESKLHPTDLLLGYSISVCQLRPSEQRGDPAGAGAPGEAWARKKRGCLTLLPLEGSSVPLFSFPERHPPKRSSAFPSTPLLPHLGPPLFFQGPHPAPLLRGLLLLCSLGVRPVNHRRLGAPARLLSASRALGVPGAPVSASLRSTQSRGDLSAELAEGGAARAAVARVTGD